MTDALTICIACPSCAAQIQLPAILDLSRSSFVKGPPPAAPDAETMKRRELRNRASFLAKNRAQTDGRYRTCHLCNASIYFNCIDKHYEQQHAAEVMAMPAEEFKL